DFISKRIKCVPQIPLFETHNSDTVGTPKASLSWTCCSPYWEDLEETVVFITGGQQSNIVNNNGDVEIGAKIDVFADNIDGVTITNLEQNKSIGVDIEYTGNIKINTENGQKSVQTKSPTTYDVQSISISYNDIQYIQERGIFVAISSGYIGISRNGKKWEYQQFSDYGAYGFIANGICYSKELDLFVVAGSNNQSHAIILKSTDLKTWEQQIVISSTYGNGLNCITYSEEKHLFVACGYSICISGDGENWTLVQSNLHPNILTDICYSKKDGKFVAVGMNDTVAISTDGENWNITTSGDLMEMFSITYSEKLELYCKSSYNGSIKTSTDAITWTSASLPAISNWAKVRWCDNIRSFVAVGQQGSITLSQDGVVWKNTGVSQISTYIPQVDLKCVCGSAEQGLLICGGKDGGLALSTNGINWEYISFNIYNGNYFSDIAYNEKEGFYIAVGGNGRVLKSYDKQNWQLTQVSQTMDFVRVIYSKKYNCFVAIVATVSLNYWYIWTSTDGTNWNTVYSSATNLSDICYSEELQQFCVCGAGIVTSTDLVDWNVQTIATVNWLYVVVYINGQYITAGADAQVFTSENGITWNAITTGLPQYVSFNDIIYLQAFNKYLFLSSEIFMTEDLIAFQEIQGVPDYAGYSCIRYYQQDGMVILFGNSQEYYSYDLVNWNPINITGQIRMCRIINNEMCLVGRPAFLSISKQGNTQNAIDKLSSNSAMTLGLEIGDNRFVLSANNGVVEGIITFRQKYIGV
ncbi:MAG: hypothetical protein IKG26_06085, partial [Bacillus sp. (in: Bacteria)]|nr:hypothetical protein [Bacillus sp. (in: firmicutes)]